MADGVLRVATLNVYGQREGWPGRRRVLADGFRGLAPDLVAFQEVLVTGGYDQVADVLGDGYHVVHHADRQADGQGISIASRWPVDEVYQVELPITPRTGDFAASALVAEIPAPEPYGPVVFVNHLPDWQLSHEYEREVQTVAVARFLEELVAQRPRHVVLAGDFDATPDAASIRFWTGRQSLEGVSVCYRDAWESAHPVEAGHTFTPENPLLRNAERGDTVSPENRLRTTAGGGRWELELGRRIDYVLVRCADHGPTLRIAGAYRIFDQPVDGVWASDHFGVCAELSATTASGHRVTDTQEGRG